MGPLAEQCSTVKCSGAVAAGQTAVNGAAVSRKNAQRVRFTVVLGAVTDGCNLTLKAQKGDQADGSDAQDVAGCTTATVVAAASSNKVLVLDVVKPANCKFVRPVLTRTGQNAAVEAIVADVYEYRRQPAPAGDVIASAVKQG